MLICRISEIQQFFTEKIIQRALHAEPLFDPAGCPTLLQPDLVELHAGNYIAGDPKTQSTPGLALPQYLGALAEYSCDHQFGCGCRGPGEIYSRARNSLPHR